ncbi:tetratricopeptide (TPR) repeat protein [Desulfobaculum xiamenense]|uniref:Tetratricopeptide (TPR) repeat protein n=1 Tax=Desulfobaculum xiamenense TaxID=995050 RepID=A0A846QSP4_9BACT|nr:tetratricopeptide repeat protein [Desulfobaculum xiamenense]NJB67669.1 tetratricopeptide (TPR) repeat protein [Desulfobaculum xiamenense]
MTLYPQILGVYSMTKSTDVGHGTTQGHHTQTTYWYVRRLDDDTYEVQPLNARHVPSGLRNALSKGDFITVYAPEPRFYEQRTIPALKSLRDKIQKGEEHYAQGKLDDAEREFLKALMIDELNVEANMGIGSVYADKGEFQKVSKVLDILLNQDASFVEEQRVRFNRFGMSLRKQGMHEEALRYYSKALEYNDKDENLHFNIARAYFDTGRKDECITHIKAALTIAPDMEPAAKFLRYVEKRGITNK